MIQFSTFSRALAPALLALTAAGGQAQDAIALRAGRVITVTGADLSNATILIKDGLIEDVLPAGTEAPWNTRVIDATDKVVMPSWVLAHQMGGYGRDGNENLANVPFLTVEDLIDPSSMFYEEARRNGVGTIHNMPGNRTLIGGQGRIVRPWGRTIADMTVRTRSGLKLSLYSNSPGGAVGQIRKMRRALRDVQDYIADFERRKAEWQKAKDAGATDEDEFPEEFDKTKKPVIDFLNCESTAYLYIPSAAEVPEVERMIREHKVKLVLVLGPATWRAADRLAKLDLPMILSPQLETVYRDPETEEEELVCVPSRLHEAGVTFALSLSDSGTGPNNYPWWQLGTCVRYGMDRASALRSLTIEPAKALGLDSELGSIEKGKIANLQILTGDPFEATTWVHSLILDGETVYERAKDARLKHLFGTER